MNGNLGRLAEKVYNYIQTGIESGSFTPSRRLPMQNELASTLSISRSTVQKAIDQLVADGLVRSIRGSGMFVVDKKSEDSIREEVNTPPFASNLDSATIAAMMIQSEMDIPKLQEAALSRSHVLCYYFQSAHNWDRESEHEFLRQVGKAGHKALIAFGTPNNGHSSDGDWALLQNSGVRVVHVEPCSEKLPEQEYMMPDYERAGSMAAVSMLLKGHKNLFFVGHETDGPHATLAEKGFAETLRDNGIEYTHDRHYLDILDMEKEREAFLKSPIGANLEAGEKMAIFIRSTEMCARWLDNLEKYDLTANNACFDLITMSVSEVKKEGDWTILQFDRQSIYEEVIAKLAENSPERIQRLVKPCLND